MKSNFLPVVCFLLIGLTLSCQEGKKEEATIIRPHKEAGARRACPNPVTYAFVKPDNDYAYNGDGCISYHVHRGSTRQIKVKMGNSAGFAQDLQLLITHPSGTSIQYTVASYTGGSISLLSPIPGSYTGEAIRWTATGMSPFTTYELVLNVTGAGSDGAENGVHLVLESPCTTTPIDDCDADENLHLVLID